MLATGANGTLEVMDGPTYEMTFRSGVPQSTTELTGCHVSKSTVYLIQFLFLFRGGLFMIFCSDVVNIFGQFVLDRRVIQVELIGIAHVRCQG